MATELLSVLEGTYEISRSGQPFMRIFFKNHKSLYEDDALTLLWPTIAKDIWKGVIEYVSRQDRCLGSS